MAKSSGNHVPVARDSERERIHLLLIEEAERGLADIAVGNVRNARDVIEGFKRRRAPQSRS